MALQIPFMQRLAPVAVPREDVCMHTPARRLAKAARASLWGTVLQQGPQQLAIISQPSASTVASRTQMQHFINWGNNGDDCREEGKNESRGEGRDIHSAGVEMPLNNI